LAVVAVGLSMFMLIEQTNDGWNFFSRYGGSVRHSIVGFEIIPEYRSVRDGKIRAQASFVHPVLAGTVGASLFSIFLVCWRQRIVSWISFVGLVSSLVVVFASSSSGPILSLVAAIISLAAWRLRYRMKLVTWAIASAVVVLQLVMTAPVWALIWRASILTGSTGYHRYALIDNAIKNLSEWWLVGTQNTAHWGFFQFDVTNQYLAAGFQGGIIGLFLFVMFLYCVLRRAGEVVHSSSYTEQDRWISWAF